MPQNITFRTQLIGAVTDFCHECGLRLFSSPLNLVELVVALSRYREEGVRLSPQVYVADDLAFLPKLLPDGDRIKIGVVEIGPEGIRAALKQAAPLAIGGWMVYLEANEQLEFGVFRGSSHPLSVPVDKVLIDPSTPSTVVKVFSMVENCVEIQSSSGLGHHVFLDHRKEDTPLPLAYLDRLVQAIVRNCDPVRRESVGGFLRKELFASMQEAHGCLVAVTNMKVPPALLSTDGVLLGVPVDFQGLVERLTKKDIEQSDLAMQGLLLRGMLRSDGILLFDSRGRVLGYNCFVKVKTIQAVVGGARRRAFGALASRIDKGLSAVFMQSQDGGTDFRESNHGN